MKNTSERIDTKILIDKFSDSQCLRGEQHDLIISLRNLRVSNELGEINVDKCTRDN